MSKKSRLPHSPRHIYLYDEDWEFLETRFGPTGFKPVGVSRVIKELIHNQVLVWREAENRATTARKRSLA